MRGSYPCVRSWMIDLGSNLLCDKVVMRGGACCR